MTSLHQEAPALGVLEIQHIARGVLCADAISKRTEVSILASRPVSGGKHLIFLRGGVAEMEEAMDAGRSAADASLVDSLELAMADEQLWSVLPKMEAWQSQEPANSAASAAIVETTTICALLDAMDGACKAAEVSIRDARLGMGIMGKAFFTMMGNLSDLQASVDAARARAGDRLLALEVIPAPADEILAQLIS